MSFDHGSQSCSRKDWSIAEVVCFKEWNIKNRYKSPTPRFFRRLRNIGIALATTGGTILAAPVLLPATIVSAAGYLAVAGTVATAVSQAVVSDKH